MEIRLYDESGTIDVCPEKTKKGQYIFSFLDTPNPIIGYTMTLNNKELYREKFIGAPFILSGGGIVQVTPPFSTMKGNNMNSKELALTTLDDQLVDWVYYDRKDDEELTNKEMDRVMKEITKEDILNTVSKWLNKNYPDMKDQ